MSFVAPWKAQGEVEATPLTGESARLQLLAITVVVANSQTRPE
jgi:hypothetical protein